MPTLGLSYTAPICVGLNSICPPQLGDAALVRKLARPLTAALSALAPALLLTLTLGAAPPAQAQTIVNICDRTAQVETALIATSQVTTGDCTMVTEEMLGAITTLYLNDKGITQIQAGDLAGLSGVTTLYLNQNNLGALPSGLFSGMTALSALYIDRSSLSTLPSDILQPVLPTLTTFVFDKNEFDTIPDGIFVDPDGDPDTAGRTNINSLNGGNQFIQNSAETTRNVKLAVTLQQLGDTVTVTVPSGAPRRMRVFLSVTGATQSSLTMTIPAGRTTTDSVTLTPLSSADTTLASFRASNPIASDVNILTGVSLYPDATPIGVCNRTPQLQAALVAAIDGADNCSEVSPTLLAAFNGTLDLSSDAAALDGAAAISILKTADFTGMDALTTLDLGGQSLTSLHPDLFDGLTALQTLNLSSNSLTSLHQDLFDGLTTLQTLNLSSNSLTSLHQDLFDGLDALQTLNLSDNSLTALHLDLLPNRPALQTLDLSNNLLTPTGLPATAFRLLASLTTLKLQGNELNYLPDGVFHQLARSLTALDVSDQFNNNPDSGGTDTPTQSSITVPITIRWGGNTTSLTFNPGAPVDLNLSLTATNTATIPSTNVPRGQSTQSVSMTASDALLPVTITSATLTAPSGTFTGLNFQPEIIVDICGRTQSVRVAILRRVRTNTCSDVTDVMLANISSGFSIPSDVPTLSSLQAGDFDGLTGITTLDLSYHVLTSLPEGVFSESSMTSLHTLLLSNNLLTPTGVPPGSFASLPALTTLDLLSNEFSTLPSKLFEGLSLPLTSYDVRNQFGDNNRVADINLFNIVMTLDFDTTSNVATVTLPVSAPEELQVSLYLFNATADTATVTIPLGATTASTTLTADSSGMAVEAILNPTPPRLSVANTGIDLYTIEPGICGRTPQVQTALLAALGLSNCATVRDFRALTSLDLSNNAPALALSMPINSLKIGDFAGLIALTELDIDGQSLTELPNFIFDGLDTLQTLKLEGNQIASWDASLLTPLTALTTLNLRANSLPVVPSLAGLTALTSIDLSANLIATVPSPPFTGLAALTSIDLSANLLTAAGLPASAFAALGSLDTVRLNDNKLASLPANLFLGMTSDLTTLDLSAQNDNASSSITVTPRVVLSSAGVQVLLPTGAPTDLNMALAVTNGSASPSQVSIAGGDSLSNSRTITVAGATTPTIAAALSGSLPAYTAASGSTPASGYGGLTIATAAAVAQNAGICARTQAVQDAILADINKRRGATTQTDPTYVFCNDVDAALLATITALDFSATTPAIATLLAGDFAGLTAMTALDLGGQRLTAVPTLTGLTALTTLDLSGNLIATVPAPPFTGLTALTSIDLSGNQLTASGLPASAFAALGSLDTVRLNDNKLAALPANLFLGMTSDLTTLDVSDQDHDNDPNSAAQGITVTLKVTLSDAGAQVLLPTGAPTDLNLTLTLTNGSANPTQVSISGGDSLSGASTITASGAMIPTIAAALSGSLPAYTAASGNTPASGYGGLTIAAAAAVAQNTGICARTQQVRDAILTSVNGAKTPTDPTYVFCNDIDATHLGAISGTFDLSVASGTSPTITALQAGDFDGLSAITTLTLNRQGLTSLPAGIFSGATLTKLQTLNLRNNQLTQMGVPASSFASLPALTSLYLSDNEFSAPPDDLFAGLTQALTSFDLKGQFSNDALVDDIDLFYVVLTLSLDTTTRVATVTVPTGAPEELTVTLDLTNATAATTSVTIAAGASTGASAPLTADSSGSALAAALNPAAPTLVATNTGLAFYTVAPGICGRTLQVQTALLAALSTSDCSTVSDLTGLTATLDLSGDAAALASSAPINTLKVGDFAGLTALTGLDLGGQRLSALPDNLFAPLTALTSLTCAPTS